MSMTKSERETIIRWDEAEHVVSVYSASAITWRKLERLGLPIDQETRAAKTGEITGRFYHLPLTDFRWGKKRPRSPAQMAAAQKAGVRLQNAKKLLHSDEEDAAKQGAA